MINQCAHIGLCYYTEALIALLSGHQDDLKPNVTSCEETREKQILITHEREALSAHKLLFRTGRGVFTRDHLGTKARVYKTHTS